MLNSPIRFAPLPAPRSGAFRSGAAARILGSLSRTIWKARGSSDSTWCQESRRWRRLWNLNRAVLRLPRAESFPLVAGVGRGLTMTLDLARLTDCIALAFGTGEFEVFSLFDQVSGRTPVVIDVGANVGTATLAFARARPDGTVFAFEPSKRMRRSLEENVRRNGLKNVQVVPLALGDEARSFALVEEMPGNPGSSYLSEAGESPDEVVSSVRLDDWMDEGTSADFMKIDVEGFEGRVLLGAERTLRRCHPAIVLEINERALVRQGTKASEVFAILKGMDYRIYVLEAGGLTPAGDDLPGRSAVFNVLALWGRGDDRRGGSLVARQAESFASAWHHGPLEGLPIRPFPRGPAPLLWSLGHRLRAADGVRRSGSGHRQRR